jgi:hypothetical protein
MNYFERKKHHVLWGLSNLVVIETELFRLTLCCGSWLMLKAGWERAGRGGACQKRWRLVWCVDVLVLFLYRSLWEWPWQAQRGLLCNNFWVVCAWELDIMCIYGYSMTIKHFQPAADLTLSTILNFLLLFSIPYFLAHTIELLCLTQIRLTK